MMGIYTIHTFVVFRTKPNIMYKPLTLIERLRVV